MASLLGAMLLLFADVTAAPDESPAVLKLIERGVSATDREWSARDMERLAEVAEALRAESPRKLPRFDSDASGRVMTRFVAEENFKSFRDRNSPTGNRLAEVIAFSLAASRMLTTYLAATNAGNEVYDRELVELQAYIVRLNLETWTLVDEIAGGMTAEERQAREPALAQIRGGSAQIATGVVSAFTETDTYRVPEMRRLARLIAPTMPSLVARLSEEAQAELRVRVKAAADGATDPELRERLSGLLPAAADCH